MVRSFLRWVVVAVALAACAFEWRITREWRSGQAALRALLQRSGVSERSPEVARGVERESDLVHARLRAARGLLADALDQRSYLELATSDQRAALFQARTAQLAIARELGERALRERPGSHEAALAIGAATYLERSARRDRRLFTDARGWEAPLVRARALAPAEREAERFLLLAYLEVWAALSPAKQAAARELLRGALLDEGTFGRLIEPWLTVADDWDDAVALVPDQAFAWRDLEPLLLRSGQAPRVCEVRERHRQAIERELPGLFREAGQRIDGGDISGGRDRLLYTLGLLPRERRFHDQLGSLLSVLPSGPRRPGESQLFAGWLERELERCLLAHCTLDPPLLSRLAGLADPLEPALTAQVALLRGDLAGAEGIERRAETKTGLSWAAALWHEIPLLIERGEREAAARALAAVEPAWRSHPVHRRRQAALDQDGEPQPPDAPGSAPWRGLSVTHYRLEVDLGQPASGLAVDLDGSDVWSLIEVTIDAAPVSCSYRESARGRLVIDQPLPAGLHWLDVRALAGAPAVPTATVFRR